MYTYKLTGTYRRQGAIGAMETFTEEINAPSPKIAMVMLREALYHCGYDHILFTKCQVQVTSWKNIPMMQALELE